MNKQLPGDIPAGTRIVITDGEYSDYTIDAFLWAVKPFNIYEEWSHLPEDDGRPDELIVGHLIAKGLAIPTPAVEICCGWDVRDGFELTHYNR